MNTRVITHYTATDTRKRCTECGEFLPRSRFHRFHAMEDGLAPWCKSCVRLPSRERHETASPGEDRIATLCREIQKKWTPGQRRRAVERAEHWITIGTVTPCGEWVDVGEVRFPLSASWHTRRVDAEAPPADAIEATGRAYIAQAAELRRRAAE